MLPSPLPWSTAIIALLRISTSSPVKAPRNVSFIARAKQITLQNAEATYAALQQWYSPSTDLWANQWWNSGSCVTTICDLATIDGNVKGDVEGVVGNTFNVAKGTAGGFLSDYYDDDGWWSLAHISAYDLTGDGEYLSTAESIFNTMRSTFGQTPCSKNSAGQGGIWWDTQHQYINAIPNELFLSVAAHLASRVQNNNAAEYRNLAQAQWAWFRGSGLINSQTLINDGLDTGSCQNNNGVVWTYNQGTILGALVELSSTTGDSSLLSTAHSIASAALTHLTDSNGILHEPCESYPEGCDADRTQFKGIFVRNLAKLMRADPGGSGGYVDFLRRNAESVWGSGSDGKGVLGVNWSGPFQGGNASTTCSGLDVLVAALGS